MGPSWHFPSNSQWMGMRLINAVLAAMAVGSWWWPAPVFVCASGDLRQAGWPENAKSGVKATKEGKLTRLQMRAVGWEPARSEDIRQLEHLIAGHGERSIATARVNTLRTEPAKGHGGAAKTACTRPLVRNGKKWPKPSVPMSAVTFSQTLTVWELNHQVEGTHKLCSQALELLRGAYQHYSHHLDQLNDSFMVRCRNGGRAIAVLLGGEVIAAAFLYEEIPVGYVATQNTPQTVVLYFAQLAEYHAQYGNYGLKPWLMERVLPEWIDERSASFGGSVKCIGTFMGLSDSRTAHALLGRLGYEVVAVSDVGGQLRQLRDDAAYRRLSEALRKVGQRTHDKLGGCASIARWDEPVIKMVGGLSAVFVDKAMHPAVQPQSAGGGHASGIRQEAEHTDHTGHMDATRGGPGAD